MLEGSIESAVLHYEASYRYVMMDFREIELNSFWSKSDSSLGAG